MDSFIQTIRTTKTTYANLEFNEACDFIEDIKSYNPLNIDYYLYNHPDKQDIGKKLIESVILYSQNETSFSSSNYLCKWWKQIYYIKDDIDMWNWELDEEDSYQLEERRIPALSERPSPHKNDYTNYFPAWNWIKFIHHRIVANCNSAESDEQLLAQIKDEMSRIFIVTFNCDLSFEQALWRYFKPSKFNKKDGKFQEYLFEDFFVNNIEHIYGKVTIKKEQESSFNPYECTDVVLRRRQLTHVFQDATGKGINIIGIDKSQEINETARGFLDSSSKVYFLGYAFDEFNNKHIDLPKVLKAGACRNVFYTNYGDGLKNDSAVRSFFDGLEFRQFQADSRVIQVGRNERTANFPDNFSPITQIVKSTKNTYEALERDLNIPLEEKV